MKKLLMLVIAALLIIPAAFALQVSSPTLTGNSGEIVSTTFTITNNDGKSLSNFNIKSDAQSSYDVQFLNVPQTLAPGSSATVTVKGKIPSGLTAKQFIGKIYVNASWTTSILSASRAHLDVISANSVSAFVHPSLQSPTQITSATLSTIVASQSAVSQRPLTAIGTAVSVSMEWLSAGQCYVGISAAQLVNCNSLQNVQFGSGAPSKSSCDSTKFKNAYVDTTTKMVLFHTNVYNYYTCEKVHYALSEGPTVPPGWNATQSGFVYGSSDLFVQPASSGGSSGSSQNYLVIDRVRMTCDAKTTTINDESSVEMNPGQTCELTIRVKNSHPDDNMEDVEVEVEPDSSDVDGGSDSISRISDGDTEEVVIPLEVASDADTGDVEVLVSVEGEDESGKKYSDSLEFNVEIVKKSHDMKISKILTSPSNLNACTNTRVDVTVAVENAGDRDEDEVAVELNVPGLNFIKKLSDLEVDEGDEERVTFTVPLSRLAKGAYKGTAKVFYDKIVVSEQKEVTINVQGCEDEEQGQSTVTTPLTELPPVVPESNFNEVEPVKRSALATALYTAVLVGANVAALTVLGVMGYGLFKKKDESVEQDSEEVPAQFY
jgi:uncharacterized membrane protein